MIGNFFKIAFRNLWKSKGYSSLNIFGLAIGITAAALIFLWIEDEVTKNDNFPNKKDLYVVKSKQKYDGVINIFESTPGPFRDAMKNEIPGIKYAARVRWSNPFLFSVGDNNIYQRGCYADPEFLDLLSVEYIEGERMSALSKPNGIVLNETAAKRLFGASNALGKTVRVNNNEDYSVSAVVKDIPKSSSFSFDWVINFKKYEQANKWLENWASNALTTLVQLEPNADLAQINNSLLDFAKTKTKGEVTYYQNFLYPMDRWNMYNNFDKDGNELEGNLKNIRLFSIIAGLVLLIACINFMNLATARSERRAKEVRIRKVVGARRTTLITQFLGESFTHALLSALIAVGLVYLSLPAFNSIVQKELVINLFKPAHIYFIIGIVLTCSILAGSYPALYLSAFNPLKTLKGAKQKTGAAGFVRRGLVVLQYTSSVVLIICTVLIYQQIQHTRSRDMGFEHSQVITTSLQGEMSKHINVIKDQLKATGNIESVGLSSYNVMEINSNSSGFEWEGKNENSEILISILNTDEDFTSSLGMNLYDGRNFRSQLGGDSTSVIINEAFAKIIKPDGKVAGQILKWNGEPYTIVGVVHDFVYNNVFATIPEPLILAPFNDENGVVNIRTKPNADLPGTIAQIEQIIKANNPGYPFDYRFLDETFNRKFSSEILIQNLALLFSVLSIIISCLGLFGLASYSAEQRAKEISIRKVLGASITNLIGMLNREFILLVCISCFVAFPIAWWFMFDWLKTYNYRIEIGWAVFAFAAGIALIIAIFTISTQAFRAATANPTKTLRNE